MNAREVPSEKDWGDYSCDLDQRSAHDVFFGKTSCEVFPAFELNVIERASELQFIGSIPFQYYMLAFRDYVISDGVLNTSMASDAASCFLRLVLFKIKEDRFSILPIIDELIPALDYVAKNQERFDADVDVYGDFSEKFNEIKGLI
ncbi:hypothetical protein [Ralstonia pseudosolanacearum]